MRFKAYDENRKFTKLIYVIYGKIPYVDIMLMASFALKEDLTDEEYEDGTISIIRIDKVNKGEEQILPSLDISV